MPFTHTVRIFSAWGRGMLHLPFSFTDIEHFIVRFLVVATSAISAYDFLQHKISKMKLRARRRKPANI